MNRKSLATRLETRTIKTMDVDPRKLRANIGSTKIILAEQVEGSELIPIDIRTRLAPQSISINELGKQLLKAAGEGDTVEIRKLMTKGAPFTADWLGTSSLHLAAQYNHLEVCELLLRAGICRDARTKVDRTPLHIAAYEGHVEIVECLLKHHADYDCRDMLNMTPLHWAAQNGHSEVAGILIRYGASTNLTNKFDLTAADLALQIDRHDIIEIINVAIRDPLIATQHLQLEMTGDSNDTIDPVIDLTENGIEPSVPIEAMLPEDDVDSENSIDPERLGTRQADVDEDVGENGSLSESLRYLQEHGITMLPVDEHNILSSVMESGHSVVLTEAGKQVLNSIKPAESLPVVKTAEKLSKPQKHNNLTTVTTKKIITITPEEFLAMTNGSLTNKILKQATGKYVTVSKNNIRRVVMKKNKIVPVSGNVNLKVIDSGNDIETVRKQLSEAQKLLDEYKVKLKKKEAEVERYKQQVRILLNAS